MSKKGWVGGTQKQEQWLVQVKKSVILTGDAYAGFAKYRLLQLQKVQVPFFRNWEDAGGVLRNEDLGLWRLPLQQEFTRNLRLAYLFLWTSVFRGPTSWLLPYFDFFSHRVILSNSDAILDTVDDVLTPSRCALDCIHTLRPRNMRSS